MTIYLVDMENIPHAWANLLDVCTEDDRFILFYTDRVSHVPLSLMEKVTKSRTAVDYVKCHGGPNGLDFQLVTEMGYRIANDPAAEYVIVSQDRGFDVVIDYWGERNIQTKRIVPSINDLGGVFPEQSADGAAEFPDSDLPSVQHIKDFLCWKLSNKVPKKEITYVAGTMMEAMEQGNDYSADRRLSCRFTYLDKTLRKKYGDHKGAKIRDQIKTVSREIFTLAPFRPEEISEPETDGEAPNETVYTRLSALGISEAKTGEIVSIISEIAQSGTGHQRAAVYRKMLSAFGREDGMELYRMIKGSVEQLIAELQEPADQPPFPLVEDENAEQREAL